MQKSGGVETIVRRQPKNETLSSSRGDGVYRSLGGSPSGERIFALQLDKRRLEAEAGAEEKKKIPVLYDNKRSKRKKCDLESLLKDRMAGPTAGKIMREGIEPGAEFVSLSRAKYG